LEEMLRVPISDGALFYGKTQQRTEVIFDPRLRARTQEAARRLHELISGGVTPSARKEPKCKRCSLIDVCLPGPGSGARSARDFLAEALSETLLAEGGEE
jgi:CRISPR-associated exonuclease Cas4